MGINTPADVGVGLVPTAVTDGTVTVGGWQTGAATDADKESRVTVEDT